jgi:hypothetical protein
MDKCNLLEDLPITFEGLGNRPFKTVRRQFVRTTVFPAALVDFRAYIRLNVLWPPWHFPSPKREKLRFRNHSIGTRWSMRVRLPETKWVCRNASRGWHKNQQIDDCAQSQNDEHDFAGSGKTGADRVLALPDEPQSSRAKQCWRCKENRSALQRPKLSSGAKSGIGAVKLIKHRAKKVSVISCERAKKTDSDSKRYRFHQTTIPRRGGCHLFKANKCGKGSLVRPSKRMCSVASS